jgi:hypothetical protein
MPAENTYDEIATSTLTSSAASVTFSSIPSTYTDLILVTNAISQSTQADQIIRFNGDSATNYSATILHGSGSAGASVRITNQSAIFINYYGNMPPSGFHQNTITQIMGYSNATTFKTVLSRSNNAMNNLDAIVGTWRSTAAITSITVICNGQNYGTGSSFSLYGIKAA